MRVFDKMDATGMEKVEGEISKSEARIVKLDAQEDEFTGVINREKEKFDGLEAQTADLDQDELADARFALRPQMEREAQNRIRRAEGGRKISLWNFQAVSAIPISCWARTIWLSGERYGNDCGALKSVKDRSVRRECASRSDKYRV